MFGFGKKKDGIETKFYDNGQKDSEIYYKDGVENGPIKHWYENGQLALTGFFLSGQRCGVFISWHENGNKMSELKYDKNGVQFGLSTSWYENGNLEARCEMNQGQICGTYETWHNNGIMSASFQALQNRKHGKSTSWNEKGEVIAVEMYSDGDLV